MDWREQIEELANLAQTECSPFNDWELEFLTSIETKMENEGWEPTAKQIEKIEELWDRHG